MVVPNSIKVLIAGSLFANVVALIASGAALQQSYIATQSLEVQRDSFRREKAVEVCLNYLDYSEEFVGAFSKWTKHLQSQLDEGVPPSELSIVDENFSGLGAELKYHMASHDILSFFSDQIIYDALLKLFEAELRGYFSASADFPYDDRRMVIETDLPDQVKDWRIAIGGMHDACKTQL